MIADLCTRHDVLCISDETYEWLTYDDARHFRIGEPVQVLTVQINISQQCSSCSELVSIFSCCILHAFLTLCHIRCCKR